MKHRHFIKQLREDEVLAALREAEGKTSGQIRIFVSHKKTDDAVAAAQKQFDRLGMARTRNRNAVLLFVAPEAHKFAVIGDTAVYTGILRVDLRQANVSAKAACAKTRRPPNRFGGSVAPRVQAAS